MEQQRMATKDVNMPNITNDSELHRKGTGPASEESESHQERTEPAVELFPDSSGDLPPEIQQILWTELDMEQEPMATQNDNMPNIASDSEHFKEGNESAGEESEADGWVLVSGMGHSTGPPGVKAHTVIAGEAFNSHEAFIQKLKLQIEKHSAEKCDVVLVFCPVVSRIGTDMEVSMTRIPADKPVILVFMHHCHHPSHMTNITVQPCRSNIVQVVHCAFQESKGLLECEENEQAVSAVRSALLSEERTELTDGRVMASQSEHSTASPEGTSLLSVIQSLSLLIPNWSFINPSQLLSAVSTWLSAVVSYLCPNPSVKAHTLIAGATFNAHETFIQKLKLQLELCSAEKCDVILLFCPVVSHIKTDMEAAMRGVTEDKPVILVFMHHCHNPSHMTNITVQPCRSNIVQVVHCAFHETKGLLECQENEQAVNAVRSTLLRYVDSQAEAPQSSTGSDIEQLLRDAQDDITDHSEPQSTAPVGERSEFHQCRDVMEMEDSSGSSGGHVPEVLQSKVDHSNVDMEEKLMVAQDGKRTQKRPSGENSGCPSSGEPTNPKKINYASSLKVHVLVTGETFQTHETFIQKLELQIEQDKDKCDVILLFCPVVSQIGTDMEAAMKGVPEDKPVILVFMHHCHNPSHMTNITVQPCRSNMQVVHCAFHETKGLLQCQENEQAVSAVRSALRRNK